MTDEEALLVRCPSCHSLSVDDPEPVERRTCPTCNSRPDADRWQIIGRYDHRNKAAQRRSELLAKRSGQEEEHTKLADYGTLEKRVQDECKKNVRVVPSPARKTAGFDSRVSASAEDKSDPDDEQEETPKPSLDSQRQYRKGARSRTPGIREPPIQQELVPVTEIEVSPSFRDWVPDLLHKTLPKTSKLFNDITDDHNINARDSPRWIREVVMDEWRQYVADSGIDMRTDRGRVEPIPSGGPAGSQMGVEENIDKTIELEVQEYYSLLTDWVFRPQALPSDEELPAEQREKIHHHLTHLGTGRGPNQAGMAALSGWFALITNSRVETVVATIDGPAWEDACDGLWVFVA